MILALRCFVWISS